MIRTDMQAQRRARKRKGSIFVEYLLLATIVGIGAIAGVATVRTALHNELIDLANAIGSIINPPQNYSP